ncbi:MAG: acyl-CoA reductase [Leptolyngbyaceae bacterium]|nr:acyl-CoA reductase [Leptolyngbyaceae bacterium]
MKSVINLPLQILVGDDKFRRHGHPLPPFSAEAMEFLSALSQSLFKNSSLRNHPDVAAFAFWCRKANLERLRREHHSPHRRLGRGLVLHITPSNVPVNFAFSLAFGLLAGNANIVRVPNTEKPQINLICAEINKLLARPEHARAVPMIRIITYPRNGELTAILSELSDARMLWGGDQTISHLRSMQTSPRCVDICFSDRYSICILEAKAIIDADRSTISKLVSGFYDDVFLLDQNACSSPHLVLWQGDAYQVESGKKRFWAEMNAFLAIKPQQATINAVDRFVHLCRTVMNFDQCEVSESWQSPISRVDLRSVMKEIDRYKGGNGFFFEAVDNDLSVLQSIVNEKYQTITYFGIKPERIIDRVIGMGLKGVDRVVPVGTALNIGMIWDGYDLIGMLTRIVSDR